MWILIFISTMSSHTLIGHFPTYENCHKESAYLTENSSYYKHWACVQLTEAEIDNLNKTKKKD